VFLALTEFGEAFIWIIFLLKSQTTQFMVGDLSLISARLLHLSEGLDDLLVNSGARKHAVFVLQNFSKPNLARWHRSRVL